MLRKSLYLILVLAAILVACYFLQPIKKGKGIDQSITYELVNNWPALAQNIKLGNPTGIGFDTNQNIIVFQRAEREWSILSAMPDKPIQSKTILILDKETGKLINSWGDNLFIMPHGLKVDKDNNIWVTDIGLHQVFKFSHDGKLLMKLGESKIAGKDSLHFNKPTDIAITEDGSFYVSDGYGNSRVVKFSSKGEYLFEWGKKGDEETEFDCPHGICVDKKGNVYVADRENNRVQVFDANGRFIGQYSDESFGAICAVTFNNTYKKLFAVDDFSFLKIKHRGSDIIIFDSTRKVVGRFGRSGSYKGNISWYHTIAIDKDDNIYVGDILGNSLQKFRKRSVR